MATKKSTTSGSRSTTARATTARSSPRKPKTSGSGTRSKATPKGATKGAARRAPPVPPMEPLITRERLLDVTGLALVMGGMLTGLAMLPSPQPSVVEPWLRIVRDTFGLLAPLVPILLLAVGVWLIARHFFPVPRASWPRTAGALLFVVALLALLALATVSRSTEHAQSLGGWLGMTLGQGAALLVGPVAAPLLMLALLVAGLLLLLDLSPQEIAAAVSGRWPRPSHRPTEPSVGGWAAPATEPEPPSRMTQMVLNLSDAVGQARERVQEWVERRRTPPFVFDTTQVDPDFPGTPAPHHQAATVVNAPHRPASTVWKLPTWRDMLEEADESVLNMEDIRTKTHIIEETLSHFGVPARVVEINRGPTVTQYGVEPGYVTRTVRGEERSTKVKVSAITSLHNDLALALAAPRIRIEAPVPGHTFVGIEVPNDQAASVTLAGTMGSEEYDETRGVLKVALGRDVMGNALVADLTRMPHLLIAGATGSGKSVCINAIIACLLCTHTPDQLKLMMVDPKMVELVGYNGIPHLIVPVVTDIERVIGLLRWTVAEMERRYKMFSEHHIRNIEAWNARAIKHGEAPLPFLVLVIDELADLMMSAADQVEAMICRLAQMARAVGIHLILATQRPSVDVVTGLIKANVPARLSFAVSSQIDSRVILDRPGAESLLGRGDMLYQAPDAGSPRRAQGCFVSDREIERINNFWIEQKAAVENQKHAAPTVPLGGTAPSAPSAPPSGMAPVSWDSLLGAADEASEEDELLAKARAIVESAGSASVSLLQRRLRIGYARAARLVDQLEDEGTIGAAVGPGKVRRLQRDEPEPGSDDDPGFDPSWIEDDKDF